MGDLNKVIKFFVRSDKAFIFLERVKGIATFFFKHLHYVYLRKTTYKQNIVRIYGGMGDAIWMAPYLKKLKMKNPQMKLIVYYTDKDEKGNPQGFSAGKSRKFSTADGKKVNAIKEYLETFSFIDELRGTPNILQGPGELWLSSDVPVFMGGHPTPQEYREAVFDELFSNEDIQRCEEFYKKHNLHEKFVVCLHFRRNADKVYTMYKLLNSRCKDVVFILMGSTEHEEIPEIEGDNVISVLDSYQKGLYLRDIFQIGIHADLYIGGRGGFEIFFWNSGIPCANFFDEDGRKEIIRGAWAKYLWKHNIIPELFNEHSNEEEIFKKHVLPIYQKKMGPS